MCNSGRRFGLSDNVSLSFICKYLHIIFSYSVAHIVDHMLPFMSLNMIRCGSTWSFLCEFFWDHWGPNSHWLHSKLKLDNHRSPVFHSRLCSSRIEFLGSCKYFLSKFQMIHSLLHQSMQNITNINWILEVSTGIIGWIGSKIVHSRDMEHY